MPLTCLHGSTNINELGFQQKLFSRSLVAAWLVMKLIASFALGFGCGLIIAIFSRTLAFLGSILAVSVYVTSRYGIDLPQILGIKKFLLKSSVWRKLGGSPWFTASFALTFTLAAFVHL
ncbi:unnamed protein product [Clonostachys chloroleuca]|uniref:Uncharacterized protein n=1 Tax=Clonostachys chloroleuca TaxID=1926264 RepID=A0AA35LWF1_9HYPO|nr:unnamed protein product [Clonostachys chloroleuca]